MDFARSLKEGKAIFLPRTPIFQVHYRGDKHCSCQHQQRVTTREMKAVRAARSLAHTPKPTNASRSDKKPVDQTQPARINTIPTYARTQVPSIARTKGAIELP